MKKSELKKILKPIVSECIHESLLEEGMISGIISEVVKGMAPSQAATPTAPQPEPMLERMQRNARSEDRSAKLDDQRTKLMSAIGKDAYNGVNLFEGTTPAPAQREASAGASPMAGQDPSDAGVDITNLFGSVGSHWNAHMGAREKGKV